MSESAKSVLMVAKKVKLGIYVAALCVVSIVGTSYLEQVDREPLESPIEIPGEWPSVDRVGLRFTSNGSS